MKKLTYFLSFFVLPCSLMAQVEITSAAAIQIGESEPTTYIDFSNQAFDSGPSGELKEWMYAHLPASMNTCSDTGLDPNDSEFRDSFPTSTVYFICRSKSIDGEETENHTFYRLDGNSFELVGNVTLSITDPDFDSIFVVYTDPILWASFPYTYLSEATDDFSATITAYAGAQKLVSLQEGTTVHKADGYGTVITPAGTFSNALRVKRTEIATNSIVGIPLTTGQESFRYTWYAEGEKGVVLNLDSIVIKDFTGNVVNTTYAGNFRSRGPMTSSIPHINKQSAMWVYPNPVADRLIIDKSPAYSGPVDLTLFDARGTKVAAFQTGSVAGTVELNLQSLPGGFYTLRMLSEGGESNWSTFLKMD